MSDLPITLADRPNDLNIRQRIWIKRVLPNTMFGRSLLLIIMPLVLVQLISAWVFYTRHWETVAHRFSADVASEIVMLGQSIQLAQTDERERDLEERRLPALAEILLGAPVALGPSARGFLERAVLGAELLVQLAELADRRCRIDGRQRGRRRAHCPDA